MLIWDQIWLREAQPHLTLGNVGQHCNIAQINNLQLEQRAESCRTLCFPCFNSISRLIASVQERERERERAKGCRRVVVDGSEVMVETGVGATSG